MAVPYLMTMQRGAEASKQNVTGAKVSDRVKNYQIYALGVLLLELAVGRVSGSGSPLKQSHGLEFAEFTEVLRLDKQNEAAKALGPRYGKIVLRCIRFDFGVEELDLRHVSLQRAFYRFVVCELEGCLKDLSHVGKNVY